MGGKEIPLHETSYGDLWRQVATTLITVLLCWAASPLVGSWWPLHLIKNPSFAEFWESVKWEFGKCSNNSDADLNVLQDKMPEIKKKPQEKGNYKLCCLAWNPYLQQRSREQLDCMRKKQQNILPSFEKYNYACEKREAGDESYWGTVWQLWTVITHKGQEGGSIRDMHQRPHVSGSIAHPWLCRPPRWDVPWQQPCLAPLGCTNNSLCIPAAQISQHQIPWGIHASCSGTASRDQPRFSHPDLCWCKPQYPSYSWPKSKPALCSYRRSVHISICIISAPGTCLPLPRQRALLEGQKETTSSTMDAYKVTILTLHQGTAPSPCLTQEVKTTLEMLNLIPVVIWNNVVQALGSCVSSYAFCASTSS